MADISEGWSETMDATEQTQKICDQVNPQVEEKTKKCYEEFIAVKYRSQVVPAASFLIKVHVGGCSYLHLKLLQNANESQIVTVDVQEDHCKDDPLVPF